MKKILFIVLLICMKQLNAQVCFKAAQTDTTVLYSTAYSVRDADFDHNGIPDMVAVSCSLTYVANVTVYMNYVPSTANFSTTNSYSLTSNSSPSDLAVADFDGDGKQDVVTVNNGTSDVSILQGNGNGTFGTVTNFTTVTGPKEVAIADFNGDSKMDMVVISNSSNNMAVHLNTSTGFGVFNFAAPTTYTINSPYAVTTANFDGINKVDIAVASNSSNMVAQFLNTGSGTFGAATTYTVGSYPYDLVTGDFNKDGKIDIATANFYGYNLSVLLGTGTAGSFTTAVNYSTTNGVYPLAIITIDFDSDGNPDLATVGTNSFSVAYVEVFMGTGLTAGTFGTAISFPATASYGAQTTLIAGDYDVDNNPDLAFSQYSYSTIAMYLNAQPIISGVNTICAGASTTLTATNSGSYSWSANAGSANTASVLLTPTGGTATYTVVGTTGTCSASAVQTVTVNSLPAIITMATPTVACLGYSVTVSAANAQTYTWSTGATTATITPSPTVATTYTVTGADVHGCVNTATIFVPLNVLDNVSGTIYDTTTTTTTHTVSAGVVYLYPYQATSTAAIDTTGLLTQAKYTTISNTNGSYLFSQVKPGNYYIEAFADTNTYHGAVPTYLSTRPNAYRWDSASVVAHAGCNNATDAGHDITIVELPALHGTGVISGTITADASFGHRYASGGNNSVMGAPIRGIDVKLGRNPGGGCAARTKTSDLDGSYQLTGLDTGRYDIYADIPNFGMTVILTATITAAVPQSLHNNYCVDSVNIGLCAPLVGIKQVAVNSSQVSVYPNPSTGHITVSASQKIDELKVLDILGNTVYATKLSDKETTLYIENSGVYFVSLVTGNQTTIKKVIVNK
ncbi:MAG TPA: T9SS type A sorting domain-containing protein [Bacteroidia bacterium]|nr:T9SS type A sorting domain-containing protein [Bacteroidia bacterium]